MGRTLRMCAATMLLVTSIFRFETAHSAIYYGAGIETYGINDEFRHSFVVGGYTPTACATLELIRIRADEFSGPFYSETSTWANLYLNQEGGSCPPSNQISWNNLGLPSPGTHVAKGTVKFFFYSGTLTTQKPAWTRTF